MRTISFILFLLTWCNIQAQENSGVKLGGNHIAFCYSGESNAVGRANVSQGVTGSMSTGQYSFEVQVYQDRTKLAIKIFNDRQYAWIELDSGTSQALLPRRYENAMRAGFSRVGDSPKPGLDFTMDGRGNNKVSGEFTIHELQYSERTGELKVLALDFIQTGENGMKDFGSLRLNSPKPISTARP